MGNWRRSPPPLHRSHAYVARAQQFREALTPRPFLARPATVKVDGGQPMLRIGMAGQMRFGEHHESGDAARTGKHMPRRIVKRVQSDLVDDARKQTAEKRDVAQCVLTTTGRLDEPLRSDLHG